MVDNVKLSVELRKDMSGSKLFKLREAGMIPAIIYGPKIKENIPIVLDRKVFREAISTEQGENALMHIKIEGKSPYTVIIKELQVHPLSMKILHVDFCQINLKESVEVEVPLEITGEAIGVKDEGGVLGHLIRKVHVRCLPTDIPAHFELDVTELGIGSGLKISDITAGKDIEILDDPEALVLSVVAATELKEPEVGEEPEEAAEPEVLKEKTAEDSEQPKEDEEKS
ncbi:50S ribosomal protein L25 [Elusimicrobiota bacterium]